MKEYKILGLMLTRDDVELLDDWLNIYEKYFDKIFCLDGSSKYLEESKKILLNHNVNYAHDSDYPNIKKKDHPLRKVVYNEIKKYIELDKNYDYWIVVVHPDEFYRFDIRDSINKAYSKNVELIKVNNCHNAPQKKEIEEWKENKSYKVFKNFLYPGHLENRIFKYNEKLYYDDSTHSKTIPYNVKDKETLVAGRALHFKICGFGEYFDKNGKTKNSCWSGLSSLYPPNMNFDKPEDFIQDKGYNKYKGHKIFKIERLDIF